MYDVFLFFCVNCILYTGGRSISTWLYPTLIMFQITKRRGKKLTNTACWAFLHLQCYEKIDMLCTDFYRCAVCPTHSKLRTYTGPLWGPQFPAFAYRNTVPIDCALTIWKRSTCVVVGLTKNNQDCELFRVTSDPINALLVIGWQAALSCRSLGN